MDLGLRGRNAVVLGGTRGIGRAIAGTLAGEGAGVAVGCLRPQRRSGHEPCCPHATTMAKPAYPIDVLRRSDSYASSCGFGGCAVFG
jgi:NAD(P)-dependent dehydrogenase (short-subunit alcohol dehydrogenase family)